MYHMQTGVGLSLPLTEPFFDIKNLLNLSENINYIKYKNTLPFWIILWYNIAV